MSYAHDGRVFNESDETARIRDVMAGWDRPPAPPAISLVKTPAGRQAVTGAMVDVIEALIASTGSVTRAALRKRFTEEEIAACFDDAMHRVRTSIRDLAAAA